MKLLLATIPVCLSVLALAGPSPSFAQATEPGSLKTGEAGNWLIHQNSGGGPKICFAATQPGTKEPAGANRSKVVMYVSAWPGDGVKSEFSVKLGYRIKPDSPISVTVDTNEFQLFADEDRAYMADAAEEQKLIDAMKKGSKLVVKATSSRGTQTTDTYSLNGLSKAMDAIATACP